MPAQQVSPQVVMQADPALAQRLAAAWSAHDGTWRNVDARTRSIPKIQTFRKGNDFWVHVWGSCVPKDCDWGRRKGRLSGDRATVRWDQGFVKRTMTLTFDGDRLTARTVSDYTDARPTRTWTETFERVKLAQLNPGILIDRGQWVLNRPATDDAGAEPEDPEADFEHAIELAAAGGDPVPGPFAGGFIGALSYELGIAGESLPLPPHPWSPPPVVGA
ncbi:MAG: hypothetical protein AAFX58_03805, partial [Pseudomonadota bacterium]